MSCLSLEAPRREEKGKKRVGARERDWTGLGDLKILPSTSILEKSFLGLGVKGKGDTTSDESGNIIGSKTRQAKERPHQISENPQTNTPRINFSPTDLPKEPQEANLEQHTKWEAIHEQAERTSRVHLPSNKSSTPDH